MSHPASNENQPADSGDNLALQVAPGERCPACHGVRGRIIARVNVVKRYNDGFKVHEYKYLRLTHRKVLRDGTLKRTYCYWGGRKAGLSSNLLP